MASATENSGKKIMLKSSDGMLFEVDEAVAVESQIIKYMIEDNFGGDIIPIPNVTGKILSMVIEYCKKHVAAAAASASAKAEDKVTSIDDELKVFDTDFIKVDLTTLFDLTMAANYLGIEGLLDLTTQTVADVIEENTPEDIRKRLLTT